MDNSYHRTYNLNRYRRLRAECLEKLGGKCAICGTTQNLEFDHIDPKTKSIELGKLLNVSQAIRDAELLKCQLLCKQHHLAKSREEAGVAHGEGKSGKRNCPCTPCKIRKAEYMREYNKIRKGK